MSSHFDTKLQHYEHPDGTFRGRTGDLSVSSDVADIIEGVFGLDDRPQAKPHFQCQNPSTVLANPKSGNVSTMSASASFSPPQLAILYNFPQGLDGSNQCIPIFELGSGYRPADLKAYFKALKLPVPEVKVIRVVGGRNQPSTADSADGEVMLDIEVVAALAPKALHVDFPPSSPYALGCGGTFLAASGNLISSEIVWNENANSATGGGVSAAFPLPTYQNSANVTQSANQGGGSRRGVPDVAGDADPASGYQVWVDGQSFVIGGISAVAPLYAGLIALINQKIGKPAGFLNPLIYGSLSGKGLFNDIATGNNGAYTTGQGWDACTGWGSPNG
jgi:subtilase family serine protease